VTVCIAALFSWSYGPNDYGKAVVTASDRQITAGDVEFEPPHFKVCFLTRKVLILIAGDYPTHSEALIHTQRHLAAMPESDPGMIAELYASFIREIKMRYAANTYLSPLGLDHRDFLARQREFAPEFVNKITNQLQSYESDQTEALVAGADDRHSFIYLVDSQSKVTCHNDVGFAAIGIGAWHAKSALMQAKYSHTLPYLPALALTFAAKKRAEIAPGVGPVTDMFLVTRNGHEPVLPELMAKTQELLSEFERKRDALVVAAMDELTSYFTRLAKEKGAPGTGKPPSTPEAEPKDPSDEESVADDEHLIDDE